MHGQAGGAIDIQGRRALTDRGVGRGLHERVELRRDGGARERAGVLLDRSPVHHPRSLVLDAARAGLHEREPALREPGEDSPLDLVGGTVVDAVARDQEPAARRLGIDRARVRAREPGSELSEADEMHDPGLADPGAAQLCLEAGRLRPWHAGDAEPGDLSERDVERALGHRGQCSVHRLRGSVLGVVRRGPARGNGRRRQQRHEPRCADHHLGWLSVSRARSYLLFTLTVQLRSSAHP